MIHDTPLREPSQQEISDCAYHHWLDEGSHGGRDEAYWFAAETELMQHWMAAMGVAWTRETAIKSQILAC